MSEFPEDIMKAAREAVSHSLGGNKSLDEFAKPIAAAILAERERCKQTLIAISADLRRQCDTLVSNWTADLGATFETKAAGAASWIINDAATSIDVKVSKLEKGGAV